MRNRVLLGVLALVLAMIACGQYITPTPTDVANTPVSTQEALPTLIPTSTKVLAVVQHTEKSVGTCVAVSADVAVYLRPSPSEDNYPIMPLPRGAELLLTGGRDGKWLFAEYGDRSGWVYGDYVGAC